MSRQRKWQIKMHAARRCQICGSPSVTAFHCELHRRQINLWQREKQRAAQGWKRRYLGAASYHFGERKAA
jgi:hypothetical protein